MNYGKKPLKMLALMLVAASVAALCACDDYENGNRIIYRNANDVSEEMRKNSNSETGVVENYLDFIANESKNVNDFLAYTYLGGEFGMAMGGEKAAEIHEIFYKAAFDELEEEEDMGYYYGEFDYRNWKDYIREAMLEEYYEDLDDEYGNWILKYEILSTDELSERKTEKLYEKLENIIEVYEDLADEVGFTKKEKNQIEDFVDYLEELEIEKAYVIEVEMSLNRDEEPFVEEFTVAKLSDEYVILDGPDFYDIRYN